MNSTVSLVQEKLITKNDFPSFSSGDTITVYYEIREGDKVRTQSFKGDLSLLRRLFGQNLSP